MDEKAYTLRALTADDMFPMFGIISKIGIKEFKDCFSSDEAKAAIKKAMKDGGEVDATTVGISVAFDVAQIIFANIGKCKDDIYLLLSGLSGMSKKEIAALPMNTFVSMIFDVVKKEEFKDFFQAAVKSFK